MRASRKILAIVFVIVFELVGIGSVLVFNLFSTVHNPIQTTTKTKIIKKGIKNIAIFGVDGRPDVEGNRSDTIMIASVNYKTGKMTLTSIQRDTLVYIPKNKVTSGGYDKINAAYSYGGPTLALKTINENFDLDIQDYVTVSFDCMIDCVNAVNGVEINIKTPSILRYTNKYISDYNRINNANAELLTDTGKHNLNGIQALAYSRNRYSDNDFGRAERQREVVSKVISKMGKLNLLTLTQLISQVYPDIKTSLTTKELLTLFNSYTQNKNHEMTSLHVPFDNYFGYGMYKGQSVIVPVTLEDNVIQLHKALYGDEKDYEPSTKVENTSENIEALGLNAGVTTSGLQSSNSSASSTTNSSSSVSSSANTAGTSTGTSQSYGRYNSSGQRSSTGRQTY